METSEYTATIGLEIHAELKTQTKMFCNSRNDPDEKQPNVNVCPVCMGHPGTLPVINKDAVKHVLRVGAALDAKLADFTEFDRKNYFYPDLPKGYQISQFKYPLVSGGTLCDIAITRIHLEEDAARSSHGADGYSLVDYNRAGVCLMELVTEPVIHSGAAAGAFARELQALLRTLDASEANMEKGEMRVEANISVSKTDKLGTKVEIKNLNSFRTVERAIAYEIERQTRALESGEKIKPETRGWDEGKQKTFSQRAKEESHDYRYFPDPDLPKLYLSEIPEFSEEVLRKRLPELPAAKRERYRREFGMKAEDIEVFVVDSNFALFFESVAKRLGDDKKKIALAVNYCTSDLVGLSHGEIKASLFERVTPAFFIALIEMISANELSSRGAKNILEIMHRDGGDPHEIALREGLLQRSNSSELEAIARQIMESNPSVVAEVKAGKAAALQFLVGQGMKASKGAANPALLQELFKKFLIG
ncbi:MAG: aspartyl-tRNA(Asn)/glutamyl-tRNA (Gln) amidotransferase subunit B [Parcubacteria group bacterium Gr01-1014_48]|nr:MAG: aspartyl-tRNA(Asn)/glutamyl-tRNA (Gln) amidotransferase subunit B [Parcubacteria group bacterium Greene0416_14]TSC72369.1 MAG: aspartyl-tRNA(Asn)/glutamyl-tRNA (Gln) amidotransferase subunit B [Parcubacteria group bacterium Gr01-1014_48]TSC99777.1 MAG: aspartyl-tRNA(Asn)/glutamyl-tRNA (Gln) amidotransferase subunit B [Parcubacteria group bacterium Greene1014_15]TSD08096.1 MAG: aspartyl-tRNA(Asn)/glutamyl-tRNA (Gln) amidotransferase subunit B [Parcubacteria group bacterium Greene0714_4]